MADGQEQRLTSGDYSIVGFKVSPAGLLLVNRAPSTLVLDSYLSEVWTLHADGSASVQLTHNRFAESDAALSPDGSRAAAVTIEGTVYAWDVTTGAELLMDAHPEAGGPPNGSLRFAEDGRLLAPTGDRRGMRLFDLTRKTSRIAGTGAKNFNAVAITDDATGFAAVTSAMESGKLVYDVEIWKMEPG